MSWVSGPLLLFKWQVPFISCFLTCVLQRHLEFHFTMLSEHDVIALGDSG